MDLFSLWVEIIYAKLYGTNSLPFFFLAILLFALTVNKVTRVASINLTVMQSCNDLPIVTLNHNNCHLPCHLLVILKVIFCKQGGPRSDCSSRSSLIWESSLIWVHTICLYAKIGLKRIFSRQHKRTTFSDAGFLGILRVNINICEWNTSKTKVKKKKIWC